MNSFLTVGSSCKREDIKIPLKKMSGISYLNGGNFLNPMAHFKDGVGQAIDRK